jgi:hypothetical protein
MRPEPFARYHNARRRAPLIWSLAMAAAAAAPLSGTASLGAQADGSANSAGRIATSNDPRIGLGAGWKDAKEASRNMELIAHHPRPDNFVNPQEPGDFGFVNSDMAFRGNLLFQGSFNGFQIWDISDVRKPVLRTTFVCPGGQGDLSVYKDILFMSVEETRGRLDCGSHGVDSAVSAERFRGVRIFDISDVEHPKQIASVQTCRGSHTHTLVTDPEDSENVYIYVSGTSTVRSGTELAGCSDRSPDEDPNTSLFRIDVIRVPLAAPQTAKVVSEPRVFADSSGRIAGLWKGGSHGEGTQETAQTDQCHDITVYSEMGLAAGACSGNGILLDISDPANPKRVDQVNDPNFAYWHSATFNNDATKVLFTDEWGGGMAPRCQASDRPQWGADAVYRLADRKLTEAGYYKLPVAQTATENCVAHNGTLIPVPGRDIMAQAWYQGGVSVFDFTDPEHPKEIAFFDRGPMSATELVLGGYWSAYWYNGHIYGSEIDRGLDVFDLKPSEQLSKNEIAAAKLVHVETFNPQNQQKIVWPASFVVSHAYIDQLARDNGLDPSRTKAIAHELDSAEKLKGEKQKAALAKLATQLESDAQRSSDPARVRALAESVRKLIAARS